MLCQYLQHQQQSSMLIAKKCQGIEEGATKKVIAMIIENLNEWALVLRCSLTKSLLRCCFLFLISSIFKMTNKAMMAANIKGGLLVSRKKTKNGRSICPKLAKYLIKIDPTS